MRTSHVAFSGRVGEGMEFVGGSYQDDNGHGTHVAGELLVSSGGYVQIST